MPGPSDSLAPLSVVGVAYHSLGVVDRAIEEPFGGLETHAWTLARALARLPATAACLVAMHKSGPRDATVDGVRLVVRREPQWQWLRREVAACLEIGKWPRVRLKRWRARLLWQIPTLAATRWFRPPPRDPRLPDPFYASLPADAMLAFGVNAVSASLVASARARAIPSVLILESDGELDARYTAGSTYVNPYGERGDVCAFALREATAIVAQSSRQQDMLRQRFGRDGAVLENPIVVEDWRRSALQPSSVRTALPDRYALWIGRFDRFHKRPLELLAVARACPEVPFVMVLAGGDADVEREVVRQRPANVRMIPRVPFDEMPAVMQGARLLVNTGSAAFEGAPNVFLQAAVLGLPIASLEADPGLIAAGRCGATAGGDPGRLAEWVSRLWSDDALHRQWGDNGRRYAEQTHDATLIARRLRELVESLLRP